MRTPSRRLLVLSLASLTGAAAIGNVQAATGKPASAAAPAVDKGRDIAAILRRGVLRVALPSFEAPPFFLQRDGALAGFDPELARAIAAEMGVATQFVRDGTTFNDAVTRVREGAADVAICKLSRTLQRALVVSFSEPYLVLRHAVAFNRVRLAEAARGRELTEVVRGFSGRIGVIARSSYVDYARRYFPKAEVLEFSDWAAVQKDLRSGEIAAAYRDEFEIKRLVKLDPTFSVAVRTVTLKDTYDSIGIAMATEAPDLRSFINLFLVQRGERLTADMLLDRYAQWLK